VFSRRRSRSGSLRMSKKSRATVRFGVFNGGRG
jgi:hypothetical protein